MPRARAIASMLRRATFRFPRSIPLMYVRSRPHLSANASWESRTAFRRSRTRLPKRFRMSDEPVMRPGSVVDDQSTDYASRETGYQDSADLRSATGEGTPHVCRRIDRKSPDWSIAEGISRLVGPARILPPLERQATFRFSIPLPGGRGRKGRLSQVSREHCRRWLRVKRRGRRVVAVRFPAR